MFNPLSMISRAAIAPFAPYLIVAAVLAAGGALAWGIHYEREIGDKRTAARYEAKLTRQKLDAAAMLNDLNNKARALEQQRDAALAELEKRDEINVKTVADLRAELVRRSRAAGGPGLRDPFAPRCGGGSPSTPGKVIASPDSGPADPAQAGGVLSAQLEGLLLTLTSEADTINTAYISCRQDAMNTRAALTP